MKTRSSKNLKMYVDSIWGKKQLVNVLVFNDEFVPVYNDESRDQLNQYIFSNVIPYIKKDLQKALEFINNNKHDIIFKVTEDLYDTGEVNKCIDEISDRFYFRADTSFNHCIAMHYLNQNLDKDTRLIGNKEIKFPLSGNKFMNMLSIEYIGVSFYLDSKEKDEHGITRYNYLMDDLSVFLKPSIDIFGGRLARVQLEKIDGHDDIYNYSNIDLVV